MGDEAGESPVYAEKSKACRARHAAPVTRPDEEPDVMRTVADRRRIAAAIWSRKALRGRNEDRPDDPGPPRRETGTL